MKYLYDGLHFAINVFDDIAGYYEHWTSRNANRDATIIIGLSGTIFVICGISLYAHDVTDALAYSFVGLSRVMLSI